MNKRKVKNDGSTVTLLTDEGVVQKHNHVDLAVILTCAFVSALLAYLGVMAYLVR